MVRARTIVGYFAVALSLFFAFLWIESYANGGWVKQINGDRGTLISAKGAIYLTQRSQAGINFVDATAVTSRWYIADFGFLSASVGALASLWQLQLPYWFFTSTMAIAAILLLRRRRTPRGFEITPN